MSIDRIKLRVPINETIHVPNINYYENLLNTSSKFDKAYYQKLIASIKKQKNYATPNQYHTLQKLKGGIQESIPSRHYFDRKEERGNILDITLPEQAYSGYNKEDTKKKLIKLLNEQLYSRLSIIESKPLGSSFRNNLLLQVMNPVLINKNNEYNIKSHFKYTDKYGDKVDGSGYSYYLIVRDDTLITLLVCSKENATNDQIIDDAKRHLTKINKIEKLDQPFIVSEKSDYKIHIEQVHGREKETELRQRPKEDTVDYIPKVSYRVGSKFFHKKYGEGIVTKTANGAHGDGDANGMLHWVDVDFGKEYLVKDKNGKFSLTKIRRISPVYTKVYFGTHLNETLQLDSFLQQVKNNYKNLPEDFFNELKNDVRYSGAPKIRFESIKAQGISKTDEVIIGTKTLQFEISRFLYTVFHEIMHQYQYRTHGKDLAMKVYKNIDLDKALDDLLEIENEADDFAIKKVKEYEKKFKFPHVNISRAYDSFPREYVKEYLRKVQQEVKQKNLTTIEQINGFIYNSIKTRL